jgi:hypothetical protein
MLTPEMKKQRRAMFLRILGEIKQLCGRRPVLSTESTEAYDNMMLQFIACFTPRDFMEQMLIKDLTDATWHMFRYTRHQTVHLERKSNQLLENRLKATAQQKQARGGASEANSAEVPAPLHQAPTELDHAEALEGGLDHMTRLDQLGNVAMAKRNDVLLQFEHYRQGLAKDLAFVVDKMLAEHRPDPLAKPIELPAELPGLSPEIAATQSSAASKLDQGETSPASQDEPPPARSPGDEHGAG